MKRIIHLQTWQLFPPIAYDMCGLSRSHKGVLVQYKYWSAQHNCHEICIRSSYSWAWERSINGILMQNIHIGFFILLSFFVGVLSEWVQAICPVMFLEHVSAANFALYASFHTAIFCSWMCCYLHFTPFSSLVDTTKTIPVPLSLLNSLKLMMIVQIVSLCRDRAELVSADDVLIGFKAQDRMTLTLL